MAPQPLDLSIPIAAGILAAWLKDDDLPVWFNYIIIGIFFVLAVLISIMTNGGFVGDLNGNLYLIGVACLTIISVIVNSKMSDVLPSPLAKLAASLNQQAVQKREFEEWRNSLKPIAQRASAVPPTPPPGGSVIAPPTIPPDQPA